MGAPVINYAMAARAVRVIMRDEKRSFDARYLQSVGMLIEGYGLTHGQAVKLTLSYLKEWRVNGVQN